MNLVKGKHLEGDLLPAKPGTCEWCAVDHQPEMPHDASSLFYQYRFFNEHGRWPNWQDAMKHCSDEMQKSWIHHLGERGVDVLNGGIYPKKNKEENRIP